MKLGVYTNMEACSWGASEELWSQAALALQQRGHLVCVNYKYWPTCPRRLEDLQRCGGQVFWRRRPRGLQKTFRSIAKRFRSADPHGQWLDQCSPDFVVINSSAHVADIAVAHACLQRGLPYVVLVHGASTAHWIDDAQLDSFREAFTGARMCYFVSHRSQEVVETNLALRLPKARIVNNPLQVRTGVALPWPSTRSGWRLACVARLDFASKGQDLILRVLSSDRWKRRPLRVCFWGEPQQHERQFLDLSRSCGVRGQVELCGFTQDVEGLWREHHGLLLPSRYEAMPVSVCEAMMCGRVPIVTDVGGNAELVEDERTGFMAAAPTAPLVDDAMERAWARREQWPEMGRRAAEQLAARYADDPVEQFVHEIEAVAAGDAVAHPPKNRRRRTPAA
jgi:glycosyltransferase involved in cell wall biosynthesis